MDLTPAIRTRYRAYLLSPEWRTRRNRALKLAGFRCTKCGSKRGLEVHHNTYERLGREWDQDLDVLCVECHEGHHVQQMYESPQRVYLKLAAELLAVQTFASIADLSAALKGECARLKMRYDAHQADKAIGLISGRTHFSRPPLPATHDEAIALGRQMSRREARELFHRICAHLHQDAGAVIKTLPPPTVSTIDIQGPIPREDYVEHDRY